MLMSGSVRKTSYSGSVDKEFQALFLSSSALPVFPVPVLLNETLKYHGRNPAPSKSIFVTKPFSVSSPVCELWSGAKT